MERNGDWLLSLLTKPEWDDDVIEMFEYFKLKRLNPKKVFAGMEGIYIDGENIRIDFDIKPSTKEQYENMHLNNLWFESITFYEDAKMKLPFGLSFGDSYQISIKKLQDNGVKIKTRYKFEHLDRLILKYNEIEYIMKLSNNKDENRTLNHVLIIVRDIKSKFEKFEPYIAPIDEY